MPASVPIVCRQIETADVDGVVAVLTHGFRAQRPRAFWARAMRLLSLHDSPAGYPRFGYLVETGGEVVGVILLIFTSIETDAAPHVRCNLSSWYMADAFRAYGPMLIARALRHRDATYFNITPVAHTLPILRVQGFTCYCAGRFVSLPLLTLRRTPADVLPFAPDMPAGGGLSGAERSLLGDHAATGCISLVCIAAGQHYPFVFAVRRRFGVLPTAVLSYCRDIAEFARFAAPIGRFLARRGFLVVSADANGPIKGLTGYYLGGKPKYVRGEHCPRIGDTAYTERTMFGS